jgi:cyclophilin family peptidyl-prolyl cis-trans isomerase
VRWSAGTNRITVRATVAANTAYRMKLVATRMRDATQTPIDGEFLGTLPSGNGKAGGNFEFQVKHDKSNTPTVRMSSNAGVINLQLARGVVPTTVNNFLNYANNGLYDDTIIHRNGRTDFVNGPIDIVQGGGYTGTDVNGSGAPTEHIDTFSPIVLEVGLNNDRGTISMARTSSPNSGTSEFFFNTADNDFLNSSGAGTGYCAFGTVTSSSLTTVDAMFDADTIAPNSAFNSVPQIGSENIFFRRIALLYRIAPV